MSAEYRHVLLQKGSPVSESDAHIIVPWWSFSKTIIAALTLLIAEGKSLSLDAQLPGKYSLRQLLHHDAGVRCYSVLSQYHRAVANGEPAWSGEQMCQEVAADTLLFSPGTAWQYSNVGYFFLRNFLQQLTGQSLADLAQQYLFEPFCLESAFLMSTVEQFSGEKTGKNYDPKWVYHGLFAGTLSDAAQLLYRLTTMSIWQRMADIKPLNVPVEGRPWSNPSYGLGVMSGTTKSGDVLIGHTGQGPGSVVAVYFDACRQCVVAGQADVNDQALVEHAIVDIVSAIS